MTFLKRVILILAEIVLFILITALLLSPQELLQSVITGISSIDWIYRFAAVLLIDTILLSAVVKQLRSGTNRYHGKELVVNAGESYTSVTQESVRQAIIKTVSKIDDIESVGCATQSKKGRAIVELEVITSKDEINIPAKQREIDRAIKQVVVKQMGLKLYKPASVMIRLASDKTNAISASTLDKKEGIPSQDKRAENNSPISKTNGKHDEPVQT